MTDERCAHVCRLHFLGRTFDVVGPGSFVAYVIPHTAWQTMSEQLLETLWSHFGQCTQCSSKDAFVVEMQVRASDFGCGHVRSPVNCGCTPTRKASAAAM